MTLVSVEQAVECDAADLRQFGDFELGQAGGEGLGCQRFDRFGALGSLAGRVDACLAVLAQLSADVIGTLIHAPSVHHWTVVPEECTVVYMFRSMEFSR